VFSEMMSSATKNEGWNEYIFVNIKNMRSNTIPKEYEALLSNPNEVIKFIHFF